MMSRSPPQKLYKTGDVHASPPAHASQHAHMKASQLVTNFHMIPPTTTPRPARNPISCRVAGSSLSSPLTPRLCSHSKSGLHPNRSASRHCMPFLLYLPAFFHGQAGWKCAARAEEESPCKLKSRWPQSVCQFRVKGAFGTHIHFITRNRRSDSSRNPTVPPTHHCQMTILAAGLTVDGPAVDQIHAGSDRNSYFTTLQKGKEQ